MRFLLPPLNCCHNIGVSATYLNNKQSYTQFNVFIPESKGEDIIDDMEIKCEIEHLNKENIEKYLPALVSIEKEVSLEMGYTFSEEVWNEKNFLYEVEGKWEYSMVALVDNVTAGFLIVSKSGNKTVHVNRIAVLPRLRSMQIGKELIERLHSLAKAIEIGKITLFVNSANEKGIIFYTRLGYKKLVGDELRNFLLSKKKESEYRTDHIQTEHDQINFVLYKEL